MTDEAILLDSLKFIREITSSEGLSHVDIFQTLWWNFTPQRKHYLYTILLEKGLITVNENAQQEVKLGAPANKYILLGDIKIKKKFLKYLKKQPDIMLFMVDNFIKPDPTGHFTRNEFDNGVNFLKSLKSDGLINYEDNDLTHVNGDWYTNPPLNTKKRWFDNQHQPIIVTLVQRRNGFLSKMPTQTNIPAINNRTKLAFIKEITIYEWAALVTILTFVIWIWLLIK